MIGDIEHPIKLMAIYMSLDKVLSLLLNFKLFVFLLLFSMNFLHIFNIHHLVDLSLLTSLFYKLPFHFIDNLFCNTTGFPQIHTSLIYFSFNSSHKINFKTNTKELLPDVLRNLRF